MTHLSIVPTSNAARTASAKPDTWSLFVSATVTDVYRAAFNALCRTTLSVSEADVNTVVHVVYARLAEKERIFLTSYDPKRSSLTTWLVLVTRIIAREYARSRIYPMAAPRQILAVMGLDVFLEDNLVPADLLEPTHKLVLLLRHAEELNVAQAACVLGVTPNQVRTVEDEAGERISGFLASLGNVPGRALLMSPCELPVQ